MVDNNNTRKDFIKKMLFGFGVIVPFSSLLFTKANKSRTKNNITIPNHKANILSKDEADRMIRDTRNPAIKKIVPEPAPARKL